jgi:hypothetical protein
MHDQDRQSVSAQAAAPRMVINASNDTSKGDLTYSETPELIFSKDFTEVLTQDISPDDLLTVRYDLARITECERGGQGYLQNLTGFYQVDDQPPSDFEYTPNFSTSHRPQSAKIRVPKGEQIAIWFYSVDSNGCESWDTNVDQKYIIPITQGEPSASEEVTQLNFQSDGEITQSGALQRGSTFKVQYDLERLDDCESVQNQIPQWGIMGHLQADDQEIERFSVTSVIGGELTALNVELTVPEGETLHLWFTASNSYGCLQEDEGASFEIK